MDDSELPRGESPAADAVPPPHPNVGLTRRHRRVVSAFLLVFLPVLALDALPGFNRFHSKLRDRIDPVLDASGLWQDGWNLFAPNVDKINSRITARVIFADGAVGHFQTPDWPALSAWERFRQFRRMEFYDDIRVDNNRGAWRGFAAYIARTTPHPYGATVAPVRVELTRHWARIPDPSERWLPAGPYTEFDHEAVFYTWEPRPSPDPPTGSEP